MATNGTCMGSSVIKRTCLLGFTPKDRKIPLKFWLSLEFFHGKIKKNSTGKKNSNLAG